MNVEPSAAAAGLATLRPRYRALAAVGEIEDDPAQRALLDRFDALSRSLAERQLVAKSHPLGWLFARRVSRLASPPRPRGLFIHGPVGRGKTMLMDLFFESAPVSHKRRAHFHEFMADIHARIGAFRDALKAGKAAGDDPIGPVADALAREERLLCFDEFAVNDIADAMILGRLFTRLFDAGVVLVATSNVAPDDLYPGGINRQLFLPFIDLLKANVDTVLLEARTDYRLEKLAAAPIYLTPAGIEAERRLDAAWRRLTGINRGPSLTLPLLGRTLVVPQAAKGVARFRFSDLCEQPLGTADYIKLAHEFHTIIVDDIPFLDATRRNEAKRFINLIDILYDHRVKLVASAAAEPDRLFAGEDGPEAFEFQRTASRLYEMRSEEYLAVGHGMPAIAAKTGH